MNVEEVVRETALQIMENIVPIGPQPEADLAIIEDNIRTAIRESKCTAPITEQ